jgi:25S rRNA (uracil2634-N3)-methyltransferase
MTFLRSASKFLTLGSIPSFLPARKHKRKADDEDDDDEGDERADAAEASYKPNSIESATKRGTILITLRNVEPYTLWSVFYANMAFTHQVNNFCRDVPRLAKNPPPPPFLSTPSNPRYILLRSFVFHRQMWKGYQHRMTKGERAGGFGKTGDGGEDRCWEFCLKENNETVGRSGI